MAVGVAASSGGAYSVALGANSTTTGQYSVAIGSAGGGARGAVVTANNAVAIGTISRATADNSIALGFGSVSDRANTVSVGASVSNPDGQTFTRQIVNVAAGTEDNDAVNVGQLNTGLSTTNASIAATNAALSTTNTTLAATNSTLSTTNTLVASLNDDMTAAKRDIATHTGDISKINDQLAGLSDGSIGLVQQSAAGADLTVGAGTDGDAVNFSGKTGTRKLTGITAGTNDSDAVNLGQMNAEFTTTNAAIAATNVELSTTNTTLAATNSTLSTTNTQVASLNDDMTAAKNDIATHTGDISKINDQLAGLSDGTIGLVQQSAAGADLTVGANTDGAAVNFSGKTGTRKLTGVTAGDVSTASTDAVNGSQLHGVADSVASAIGGGSTVNPDGSISAPSFSVGDGAGGTKIVNSVGDVVTNLDDRVKTNEGGIKDLAEQIGSGTVGLVQQASPGDDITVGANTDGAAVNFAGKTGTRKLTGITAGDVSTASTDAVNGSQLHGVADSVASAIGGGSTVNPDGSISAPSFTVGDGAGGTKIVKSVGDVVTNIDGRVTNNEGKISDLAEQIGSGTVGLVQQANPGDDITVGANTGGNAVNFAGKTGTRKLTGVTAGDVSAASTDAVNGSQLHGVADSVASAIGGGSTVNPDGSISAPSFTVGDGAGGTKIVKSVGDVVTNIDGRVTNNEGKISDLAEQIGSGTVGLVQQANPGDDITVGANTGGAAVNFASATGNRKLTGIEAGTDASDAVNVGQMNAGLSTANARIDATNADLSTTNTTLAATNTALSTAQGTIATHTNEITNINNQLSGLSDGTLGLVKQDAASGTITVGAGTGGSVVNFAGSGGPRVLSGVANGVHDDDVVTISQLRATGLIDYTGKEVGAVTYDTGLSFDSVTFAGTNGTVLRQVAAGAINATSMEAVNGSQLYALQEQFAKQYGDLSGQFGDLSTRFDDLAGRIGDLKENPGTGGPGTGNGSTVVGEGAVASGENSSAIGDSALASGENSSAVGQGAVASGSNSSAVGQGSVASGDNSSALGQGAVASGSNGTALGQGSAASGSNGTAVGQSAVASGDNSTSLGQGAVASGNNSVAIGQGSVAAEANTVSFGDGTAEGNRRLVNIADGVNNSDAATVGQLGRAMESVDQRFNDTNRAINDVAKNAYAGIAAAMAMPNMTPSQPGKTVVAVGAANFKSGSAIAAGATYRSRNGNWLVNGATSVTSVGDVGIRAQVGYEF
ncbi:YadA-like family protein [Burkholderia cenocepacia]|uniref:YadA-like family protein n=1 Tax=Burkholderia cenocepacia TaxID=95486 RepID=UPI0031FC7686